MSQFDLTQLSKKNQEFVRIAKHQLIENGKTEEEATSLIEEILPAIFENQPKGVTARTLFGAPTVWANAFSDQERYEKEHPKDNDAPHLMITDSFLLVFGLFAAISAFMNLFAPQGTTYGLLTLTLGSLAGGVVLYLMYYYFYQYYEVSKRGMKRPALTKSLPILMLAMILWVVILMVTALLPQFLNPRVPNWFMLLLGGGALLLRYYLKKKYNIKSANTAPQRR